MMKLFLESRAKRVAWKKACAGFLMLSLNLSLGGLGGLLLIPQVASAAKPETGPGYLISGTATPNGLSVSVFGEASADPITGQENDQHVSIDWNEDNSPNASNANGDWETVLTIPDFVGDSFASTSWTGSHPYPAAGPYKIFVRVHHAEPGGAESGSGEVSFTVELLPQCNDGVDNDSDSLTDYPSDPGCSSATDDDEYNVPADTTPPTVEITAPADESTTGPSGDVTYTVSDGTVSCTLDGEPVICSETGPYSFSDLPDGEHTFVVTGTDDASNSASDIVTWTVDATGPVVTITSGPDTLTESTDATFVFETEILALTLCSIDGGTSVSCTSPTDYSALAPGEHEFRVYAVDEFGNVGPTESYTWTVDGNDAPVITLTGFDPLNLILGIDVYDEPGATADDEEDGSGLTVTDITGTVNSLVIGVYEVVYNFIDTGGLSAETVVRTVNVNPGTTECSDGVSNDSDGDVDMADEGCDGFQDDSENETPVITLNGGTVEIVVNVGSYAEQGATADDAEDGLDIPVTDIDATDVNTSAVGTYQVTYDYTDEDGTPAATEIRTVNVVYGNNECNDGTDNDGDGNSDGADSGCSSVEDTSENTPPVVIIDTEMIMLTLGSVFNPPVGVYATDVEDDAQSIPVVIEVLGNTVNVNEIGDYTVTYGATDSDEASADPETQTVKVRAECGDGLDNDEDGRTDASDPACHLDGDSENEASYDQTLGDESGDPECDDGVNNDGDESVDADDSGCSSPADNDENTPPVIETELVALTLTAGNPLVLPDYSASDSEDGDITGDVATDGVDDVDTDTPGTYEVTLNVTDSDGAAADPVVITVTVVADLCPNIEGAQEEIPDGMMLDNEGQCVTIPPPPPADVCPNIEGTQASVPEGMTLNEGQCVANETPAPPPSGGGGGGGGGGGSGAPAQPPYFTPIVPAPQGEVLGAATTDELPLPPGCSAYLNQYLKKGRSTNKIEEVKLLQTFLNEEMAAGLPITGYFGNLTHSAVMKFQVKYKKEILQPWIDAGYGGMDFGNKGTGYVYKTTKRAINMMKCAEIAEPMPELVPDTQP